MRVVILSACIGLLTGCGGGSTTVPVTPMPAPAVAPAPSAAGVPADDRALCVAFRREWVSNFVRHVYDQQKGSSDLPSSRPFADRMAAQNSALWDQIKARGLDQVKCQVPLCYTRPHSGWWEPHCGYRVPNTTGTGGLYSWVPWRDGVEPPAREALEAVRRVELENNKRVRSCGDNRGSLC